MAVSVSSNQLLSDQIQSPIYIIYQRTRNQEHNSRICLIFRKTDFLSERPRNYSLVKFQIWVYILPTQQLINFLKGLFKNWEHSAPREQSFYESMTVISSARFGCTQIYFITKQVWLIPSNTWTLANYQASGGIRQNGHARNCKSYKISLATKSVYIFHLQHGHPLEKNYCSL